MNIESPTLDWWRKAGVFLAFCLGTDVLMRMLMLSWDLILSLPLAVLALVGGATLAWFTLRRWRFVAPLRCASELGVCAGIGGFGLYTIFWDGVFDLLSPRVGLMQNF